MSDHRIRDFPVSLGCLPIGARNSITDVAGVRVGHKTLNEGTVRTGVTVVIPGEGNPFTTKYTAAAFVQNGFGKSVGLMQIEELGTLETPIALTNTLNVGKVSDALNEYIIGQSKNEGLVVGSINPVVGECNDSVLHDIQQRCIGYAEVMEAIETANKDFIQGDVGAGRSTICFGFKGGIGSASRIITVRGVENKIGTSSSECEQSYTIGVLVQSNFGATKDFILNGKPLGRWWLEQYQRIQAGQNLETSQADADLCKYGEFAYSESDQGSIIVIVATDLPVNDRQLKRIIKRAGVGIMRTGAYIGHGSGEVMIGFTTANRVPYDGPLFNTQQIIRDSALNPAFLGVAEATYEAILNSLVAAEAATSKDGYKYESLYEVLKQYEDLIAKI
ncbi:P1 family peptidase [Veillonella criceti]|uniref:L-aminopeptidase/D-esterase n=1 Tax=Veillonella criceti TaxID=103891 RepID=A0A380NL02_9FIRM|nr:P1 family peptidase [Veillonella criceti]SUP43364.1 L-aminopeptidase/D-esterase [Veillonella criceti]